MSGSLPGPIRVLPEHVAARIAAGEVITRPLSVVRELLDNAIDAGATDIVVEIERGGYDLIAVHDNGAGIAAADAPLLGIRHATSKLPDDAIDGIATLGFRGEALASIIAVADVEIRTRRSDEMAGTRFVSAGGAQLSCGPVGRQPGTSVEVRRLFARYPVRRAVAEPGQEQAAIQRWLAHLALVQHGVSMTLRVDGRVRLQTDGTSLMAAVAAVLGDSIAHWLRPFGPFEIDGVVAGGVAGGPSLHRSRRDQVVVAVNRRLCDVPAISRALDRVFADIYPRRRYPYVLLLLDVPLDAVDVNVHPAKEQVALLHAESVGRALERELRAELGRGFHEPLAGLALALTDADLPGLRAAERGEPYDAVGSWGTLTVESGSLPRLRVIGQIDDTLIVCETELGTLLVDQHRAHERVIFERLATRLVDEHEPPVVITLTERHAAVIHDRLDDLSDAGWRVHERSPNAWEVHALPNGFEPSDLPGVLEQALIDERHSLLAAAACHAAIRKRRPISPHAAVELLEALTATSLPTTCPHGQPIVLRLDRSFLERQFAWR